MRMRGAVCILLMLLTMPAYSGASAMVPTSALWQLPSGDLGHADRLLKRLESLGVEPSAARARVAALTEKERRLVMERLEHLPAGGDALAVLAFSALVLLLTDILGYTDVYPFVTRSINGEKATRTETGRCVPSAAVEARQ